MSGWRVSVLKQAADADSPAAFRDKSGACLATWQTGACGLRWIDDLVKRGQAISLGGYGYPTQYTGKLEHLRAPIVDGPPDANAHWVIAEGSTLTGTPPASPTHIYEEALRECDDAEWVIVDVWDES